MTFGEEPDMAEQLRKMKEKGRTVSEQMNHSGSRSGQEWQPDEETRRRLGDAYGIVKEIIEEP